MSDSHILRRRQAPEAAALRAVIVALRAEGLTNSQICARLGVTMGTVSGQLWRAGVTSAKSSLSSVHTTPGASSTIIEFPPPAHCQFIDGHTPATWRFCGEAVADEGGVWCAEHRARVYQPRKAAE